MVILDTDHMTFLTYEESVARRNLDHRLEALDTSEIATTIVTFEEQTRGWLAYLARDQSPAWLIHGYGQLGKLLMVYRSIQVLEFDQPAASIYTLLKQSKIRIGSMDLRIAAIVLARGATLLSRNLGDFRKVTGLVVEDWSV